MFNTTLYPRGQYRVDEEADEKLREIAPMDPPEGEDELEPPTTTQMGHAGMWVHALPNILLNCRTKHGDPEEPEGGDAEEFNAEEAAEAMVAADPYEPRLKPISMDSKVKVSEKIS